MQHEFFVSRKEAVAMPEISNFFGIRITINYSDHNPPHIHAAFGIQKQIAFRGWLPSKKLKLVLGWCVLHEQELMDNWELVKQGQKPKAIAPL